MQTNDGNLVFDVKANYEGLQKDVEAIKKQFEQMTHKAVEEGKKQADVWQTLLKGATAYFTLQGAQSFISQMVAVRSEFQQGESQRPNGSDDRTCSQNPLRITRSI